MDLRHIDVPPSDEERASVDRVLGPPPSGWEGGEVRSHADTRVAMLGRDARRRRHLLLPVLDAVQSDIGWVSKGALGYICRRLTVPPAEAYGVASFYSLLSLEERPPIVLHVCDDVCCRGRGAEDVIATLETSVGPEGVAADGLTWLRSPCLGQCDRAPAVFVQRAGSPDSVLAPADPERIVENAFAAAGGTPMVQVREPGPVTAGIGTVDQSSLDAYRDAGGYEALRTAISMGAVAVVDAVKRSNLRGRGGAAFPAGVKWEAVAQAAGDERHLVCNADESEPGTFKDRTLIEGRPFALLEAMTIAGFAVGATVGHVYLRGEYPDARRRLEGAVEAARGAGLLGPDVLGSGVAFDVEIRRGQGAYICGEETALFNSIEGYRGEPRQKPPFPTDRGLFGRPTLVNNVETLLNVLTIVTGGGEAFAATGTAESAGTRLFSVSGDVERPGVYEREMGSGLDDLLASAGAPEDAVVLLGGAAGSFVPRDRMDVPLSFEGTRAAGLTLGSGAVIVFGKDRDMLDVVRRIARFFRDESCGQCVPCRVGTVRVEELLVRAGDGASVDRELLDDLDAAMKDASICGLGHTATSAIRSALDLGLVER
jgi:NADH-quinone oxidoreductase subunit F